MGMGLHSISIWYCNLYYPLACARVQETSQIHRGMVKLDDYEVANIDSRIIKFASKLNQRKHQGMKKGRIEIVRVQVSIYSSPLLSSESLSSLRERGASLSSAHLPLQTWVARKSLIPSIPWSPGPLSLIER